MTFSSATFGRVTLVKMLPSLMFLIYHSKVYTDMFKIVFLGVIPPTVVLTSGILQCGILQSGILLRVILLRVILLIVILMSAERLSVDNH